VLNKGPQGTGPQGGLGLTKSQQGSPCAILDGISCQMETAPWRQLGTHSPHMAMLHSCTTTQEHGGSISCIAAGTQFLLGKLHLHKSHWLLSVLEGHDSSCSRLRWF
jgi:hypothetical protein